MAMDSIVSKLFRAYGLYNRKFAFGEAILVEFQSSFELTGYITFSVGTSVPWKEPRFKALSSLRVI